MRAWWAMVVAAVLALSAGDTNASSPNVRGVLSRGPVMPVCIVERPCDAPAPGVVLVFWSAGAEVKRVTTGTGGRFALRLRPGSYAVRTLRRPRLGSGLTPTRLRVPAHGVVTVRLYLDTGIR